MGGLLSLSFPKFNSLFSLWTCSILSLRQCSCICVRPSCSSLTCHGTHARLPSGPSMSLWKTLRSLRMALLRKRVVPININNYNKQNMVLNIWVSSLLSSKSRKSFLLPTVPRGRYSHHGIYRTAKLSHSTGT